MSNVAMESLSFEDIDSCTRVRFQVSEPVFPTNGTFPETPQETRICTNETIENMSKLNDTESILATVVEAMQSSCVATDVTDDNIFGGGGVEGRYQACEANFDLPSNSMGDSCRNIVNGLYLEVDYTLTCQHPSEDPMMVSVIADPLCSSRTFCTLQELQQIATDHANRIFFASSPSEWNCTTLRIQLEDFAVSASPTVSVAPSLSPAPSSTPTLTASPSKSPAPTPASLAENCLEMSVSLNATTAIQDWLLGWSTTIETCELEIASNNTSNSTSNANIRRTIDLESPCKIVKYSPLKNLDDLRSICEATGGLYAEEIFTIHCESSTDDETIMERRIWNKPVCRHPECDAVGFQEVLREEMEWMRSAMTIETLECDIRHIKVLARTGNVDGFLADGSLPEEFQVSSECRAESDLLDTIIAIYNELQLIVQNFEEYTQVDMRQICVSPTPGTLNCQFDWEVFSETDSLATFELLCEDNGGQFVTGEYVTICSKTDEKNVMNMYSRNVPGCLGISCSPGQAELYLTDADDSWIAQQYEKEGWVCETSVTSLFTPSYMTAEERAMFTGSPSRAPQTVTAPTTLGPIATPTSKEPDESDPLGGSTSTTAPAGTESKAKANDVPAEDDDSEKLSNGIITGIAIGAALGFCVCYAGLYYFLKRWCYTAEKKNADYGGEGFDDETGGSIHGGGGDGFDDEMGDSYSGGTDDGDGFDEEMGSDREDEEGSDDDEGDEWDDDEDSSGEESDEFKE